LNIELHEGVYGNAGGPTYETVTDAHFCRLAACDTLGLFLINTLL
jgi:hypothetical protein